MSEQDILYEMRGPVALITLHRPRALNALTHDMVLDLERQLDAWRDDPEVAAVVIRGAGERAFCAGGDIRVLYENGRPGGERGRNNFAFYADEYRMNTKVKRFPKPYIALMDGITMGGGVGVSIHGWLRVATERTLFAMPETGIGLFPDVGGTYFLPRLPGELGMWLGLTGARLRSEDTLRAGVCDAFLPAERIEGLIEHLASAVDWERARADLRGALAGAGLSWEVEGEIAHRAEIDRLFAGDSVEAILAALAAEGTEWALAQRETILRKSPTSTRIAFRQIRTGAGLDFEDCMRLEYRLARFCMTHGDFYEGVRATIIDKDNAPRWNPASLEEATEDFVAPAFAPLPEGEELRF